MSVRIDVVIAARDAATTLGAALDSVRQQRVVPGRVIVVADSCTDKTADVAHAGGASVVVAEVGAAGRARNLGLQSADGEYCAFLDADDVWKPTWLAAVHAALASAQVPALVAGGVWVQASSGRTLARPLVAVPPGESTWRRAVLRGPLFTTSAMVVHRQTALEVEGFESALRQAEDFDLWLRLIERGLPPLVVPGLHVTYVESPNSEMRNPGTLDALTASHQHALERAAARRPLERRAEAEAYVQRAAAQRAIVAGDSVRARAHAVAALRWMPQDPRHAILLAAAYAPLAVTRRVRDWRRAWRATRA